MLSPSLEIAIALMGLVSVVRTNEDGVMSDDMMSDVVTSDE